MKTSWNESSLISAVNELEDGVKRKCQHWNFSKELTSYFHFAAQLFSFFTYIKWKMFLQTLFFVQTKISVPPKNSLCSLRIGNILSHVFRWKKNKMSKPLFQEWRLFSIFLIKIFNFARKIFKNSSNDRFEPNFDCRKKKRKFIKLHFFYNRIGILQYWLNIIAFLVLLYVISEFKLIIDHLSYIPTLFSLYK